MTVYDEALSAISTLPISEVVANLISGMYDDQHQLKDFARHIIVGGYRFSSREELIGLKRVCSKAPIKLGHFGGLEENFFWTLAHIFADCGYIFRVAELLLMHNPRNSRNGISVAHLMAKHGHYFTFEQLLQLRNLPDKDGETIAHVMALHGFQFNFDQLIRLKDCRDSEGRTISFYMAYTGKYQFTFEELIRLKNPADKRGITVAHWMARHGHRFSLAELLKLKNPVIKNYFKDFWNRWQLYNVTVASSNFDEDFVYESKDEVSHFGATIAHIMAREGHRFTVEEIKALHNPQDAYGLTISDWMAKRGNPLTAEELEQLKQ